MALSQSQIEDMIRLSLANFSGSGIQTNTTLNIVYPEWVFMSFSYLVNAEFETWFLYIVDYGINGLLSVFGVFNNIIMIMVLGKLGYKETTNITMTAIAFWDIIKNTIFAAYRLRPIAGYFPPPLRSTYHAISIALFEPISNIATHASSMLAAYIALERCLCVSMPFTVRFLLTRKTAIVSCLAASAFVIGTFVMDFMAYRLEINKSYYNYTYIGRHQTDFLINNYGLWVDYIGGLNTAYPVVTFCFTSVCTAIIVYHLQKSSRFRSENKKDGSKQMPTRERKTTKMLVVILIFYLIYFIPWIGYYNANRIIMALFYFWIMDLKWFMYQIALFFSLLNSFVNLFIFYNMSTEFRRTLRKMIHLPIEKTLTSKK